MQRRVFGFGETVLDIIFKSGQPVAGKPGGSVLNSFVSLGRLGWNPCFITEYGYDRVGDLIEGFLNENGVNTDFVNRFKDGQSALALAFLDEENNADYSFYKDFPEERLQRLPLDIQHSDVVLFGSIYASNREVRRSVLRFLEAARSENALIVYDPNFRSAHLHELDELKPRIIENIAYADIVRGSDEDFRLIFGADSPADLMTKIDAGDRLFVYTRNSGPVSIFRGSDQVDIPVAPIVPVSTIGAGDNFNAGIIHHLLQQGVSREELSSLDMEDWREMGKSGVRFAANVCLFYENYISEDFAERLSTGS